MIIPNCPKYIDNVKILLYTVTVHNNKKENGSKIKAFFFNSNIFFELSKQIYVEGNVYTTKYFTDLIVRGLMFSIYCH